MGRQSGLLKKLWVDVWLGNGINERGNVEEERKEFNRSFWAQLFKAAVKRQAVMQCGTNVSSPPEWMSLISLFGGLVGKPGFFWRSNRVFKT